MARPDTVYFFGTCLIDLFYPGAGMAGMELLKQAGMRVVFPREQTCCGQPARNSGFMDEARAVALQQIRSFPQDWPIVVPSGSCAGMMRVHYPDLFAGRPELPQVQAFAARVHELTSFLVNVLDLQIKDRGKPVRVALHSSCSSRREMGVVDEPKSLLRQLANVTLIDIPRETECCGFGGAFSVKQPEISAAMVTDKVAAIDSTGAAEVVSVIAGA